CGLPEVDLSTRSVRMRAIVETAMRVAATDASVLVRGENGTGSLPCDGSSGGCPSLSDIGHELVGESSSAFAGVPEPSRDARITWLATACAISTSSSWPHCCVPKLGSMYGLSGR